MAFVDANDVDLVAACRAGDRDAFGEIVSRYQSLVCSIAYSATGSLTQSEDVAQETFLAAWKQLGTLSEPAKLRSWLCGIARNLVNNTLRRQGREPSHAAEPIDAAHESPSAEPPLEAQVITKEEEAILWRSLEQIPETYREPLVLFYREQQSVERVATQLELSEDAVKQRLSRGRKLLQDHVLAVVEGTLRRTTPGRAFTVGVIASLPAVMATSASAATVGAAAAKGSAAAKTAGAMGILSILIGPLMGIFGAWLGVRASIDCARSTREREFIIRKSRQLLLMIVAFGAVLVTVISWSLRAGARDGMMTTVLLMGVSVSYVIVLLYMIVRFNREQRAIREEESEAGRAVPEESITALWQAYEYRSPATFLGIPLLHVRSGRKKGEKLRPVVGWIAVGDFSFGILLSFGGIAVGGVSFGGLSLGLLSMGGLAVGVLSFGGLAAGLWAATGGMAVGYLAHGGYALAWHAAMGGIASAQEFAVGGVAHAAHANDAAARAVVESTRFFKVAGDVTRGSGWLSLGCWLPMLLVWWQSQRVRNALRRQQQGS